MPFSHLTLTVTNLPSSTSFFLACLQPLGYQFIGRSDEYIGFGQTPGEPADFWITEQKPGTPAGAAHIAFPAPSKDAVGSFFVCALKAGGKFHGEPKNRDPATGYYSAAVLDADGNSIEAVFRSSTPSTRSEISVSPRGLIENGSVVSKTRSRVSSVKPETVVSKSRARGPESHFSETATAVDRSLPSIISQQPQRTTASAYEANQSPHDNKTAKTIVGTLIGAAAGAAVAYAMTKSEPQSENSPDPTRAPEREYPQLLPSQAQSPERQDYRAVEAPARSIYSQAPSEARPGLMTRSVSSKNPRASTAYTGTGSEYPHGPVPENIHQYDYDDIPRRQSDGSIYTTRDLPIRAIEYRPDSHAHAYPQPTLISSFGERSRTGTGTGTGTGKPGSGSRSGSIYSTSTIKPSKSKSHCSTATFTPTPNRAGDSTTSTNTAHRIPLPQSTTPSVSSYRSTKSQESARNVPLPESVAGRSSSGVSARHVPLPESVAGGSSSRASSSSKVYSYSPSKAGSNANSMASSKRSAAFEEPVRPCDSISQVSSNRTVKAAGSRC